MTAPVTAATSAAAGKIALGNIASRVTGLARVVVVSAALGTTFLGNTYQTANLVSNILFELLAAGVLSAVLVPAFVRLFDSGQHEEAEHLGGSLLGLALAGLGLVVVLAMIARPVIMKVLTLAVPDPEIRALEVRLGSFFLVFFLPQVLFYATGSVATAMLYACRRFTAAAFAPVANNVVVVAAMGGFWWLFQRRGDGPAGLDLDGPEKMVLAIGTTAGVVAMSAVPLVALRRAGVRLRPRWDPTSPRLRALGGAAAWGAVYLVLNQMLIAITLVLANRVEGGVVAYQVAFTIFLLPHAVFAHPVVTAAYPDLAAEAGSGRWSRFAVSLTGAARTLVFLLLPASALMIVLGEPAARLLRLGAVDADGAVMVAKVLSAYALGLAGYSTYLLFTRASYAAGDTRGPALVNLGVAAGGTGLMILCFAVAGGANRVAVLGLAHSVAMVLGAIVLALLVQARVRSQDPHAGSYSHRLRLVQSLAATAAAGLVAWGVRQVLGSGGRWAAASVVMLGGVAGMAVYVAVQWVLHAPELRHGHWRGLLGRAVPAVTPDTVAAPDGEHTP